VRTTKVLAVDSTCTECFGTEASIPSKDDKRNLKNKNENIKK
jgi:hypothetical protein